MEFLRLEHDWPTVPHIVYRPRGSEDDPETPIGPTMLFRGNRRRSGIAGQYELADPVTAEALAIAIISRIERRDDDDARRIGALLSGVVRAGFANKATVLQLVRNRQAS